jgi:predicted Zn finger-like uncharacterized protein
VNVVCPSCQARYRFDERKLGDRPRARTKCAKCGGAIEIVNPAIVSGSVDEAPATRPPAEPAPPPAEPPAEGQHTTRRSTVVREPTARRPDPQDATDPGSMTGQDLKGMLELPTDRRFSLAIIQGEATGQIHPITKVRTTIGRVGADINLDDPEASRQHAAVEIMGEHAVVRDVGSTNGTFVEGSRIEHEVLTNHMEFRIGSHVLMFIVTTIE